MAEKLTLDEFKLRFGDLKADDETFAETIIEHLPEGHPLVVAARGFLGACEAYDRAVEAAGLNRD